MKIIEKNDFLTSAEVVGRLDGCRVECRLLWQMPCDSSVHTETISKAMLRRMMQHAEDNWADRDHDPLASVEVPVSETVWQHDDGSKTHILYLEFWNQ